MSAAPGPSERGQVGLAAALVAAFGRSGVILDDREALVGEVEEISDKTLGTWQMAMATGVGQGVALALLDHQLVLLAAVREVLGMSPVLTAQEMYTQGFAESVRWCTQCGHPAAEGTGYGPWSCGRGCHIEGGCSPGDVFDRAEVASDG